MSRLSRADKIAIGEISINLLGASHSVVAKAKIVSTKTGASYGSMTVQHWSQVVQNKMNDLRDAMEVELEAIFFDEGVEATVGDKNLPGLGEFLDDDDTAKSA